MERQQQDQTRDRWSDMHAGAWQAGKKVSRTAEYGHVTCDGSLARHTSLPARLLAACSVPCARLVWSTRDRAWGAACQLRYMRYMRVACTYLIPPPNCVVHKSVPRLHSHCEWVRLECCLSSLGFGLSTASRIAHSSSSNGVVAPAHMATFAKAKRLEDTASAACALGRARAGPPRRGDGA